MSAAPLSFSLTQEENMRRPFTLLFPVAFLVVGCADHGRRGDRMRCHLPCRLIGQGHPPSEGLAEGHCLYLWYCRVCDSDALGQL